MQFFLVGGAVRDELLNMPVKERDWVVLGATPKQMLEQGFTAVGKDFPVFLHPKTKEEYALARTERKTAPGYTGFQFYAAPDVTLEQDLARRDLTINAIAKTGANQWVDPYGGRQDINAKILRHVSAAFTEDPVRILRVARFAARYRHLGFTVAEQTNALMAHMVNAGEVSHLVAERVWKELSRALLEPTPEAFIQTLRDCGALNVILPELDALFGVPQRKEYHPEVDTGVHTLMSLQAACALSQSAEVRFAVLLHDLGKALTPADILPRHHGHEITSAKLARKVCARLKAPKAFAKLAEHVAEFHTHSHRAMELTPKKIVALFNQLGAFKSSEYLEYFLLACKADAQGRLGFENTSYPQMDYLMGALTACKPIIAAPFLKQGLQGPQIGEAIHKARIHAVKSYKASAS